MQKKIAELFQDIEARFPNLSALAHGAVSGRTSEWPMLKVEARRMIVELAFSDVIDVVRSLSAHDAERFFWAISADWNSAEQLLKAIGALQSTDDPALVPLHNELLARWRELAGQDRPIEEKTTEEMGAGPEATTPIDAEDLCSCGLHLATHFAESERVLTHARSPLSRDEAPFCRACFAPWPCPKSPAP